MRALSSWGIGAVLVAAAWLVGHLSPAEDAYSAPFAVHAELGEEATGRDIAVTVLEVRAAGEELSGGWVTPGVWVVLDLEAASVRSESASSLAHATLRVGDRSYRATERLPGLFRTQLGAGIARSGSIAFEIPADEMAGVATLELGTSTETRLDSLIVVPIDLDAVQVEDEVALRPTRWAADE